MVPLRPYGHALRAIWNAVVSRAVKLRARGCSVSGLEGDPIDVAVEFGIIEIIVPGIFGDADGTVTRSHLWYRRSAVCEDWCSAKTVRPGAELPGRPMPAVRRSR